MESEIKPASLSDSLCSSLQRCCPSGSSRLPQVGISPAEELPESGYRPTDFELISED